MQLRVKRWKRAGIGILVLVLMTGGGSGLNGHAATSESAAPSWSTPTEVALRKTAGLQGAQKEPNMLSNLDCELLTYRLVADATMRTGCFSEAAFGLIDTDSDTVIFNGTDEGVALLPYSNQEVLVPWPKALDVVALDATATGGSYVSLYKNPLPTLQDQRSLAGQLTAKRLAAPPELPLVDVNGQKLIVNVQTLAFTDNGSWLVAESLGGSFLRINLATLATTPFARAYAASGTPALFKSQVAMSADGRYAAINNEAANAFKVYDLATCPPAQSGECPSHDYRAFLRQQLPGLQSIRHVRFVNESLISFEATSSNSAESGSYLLAPTGNITSLTDYIGLGDSYTSGEGAFDYRAGTDTSDNLCHLSGVSYPLLLTHDLFSAASGHSVACSGATINDVASTSSGYHGQVGHSYSYSELQQSQPALLASVEVNYLPGYIAQHRFVQQNQPKVLTVSVGGDDVGFGDIVTTCVLPHISVHYSDDTCFNTYEDRLELIKTVDRTTKRWQALFKQLHAESPLTNIFVVGYPDIISDTGNCALNVHLNQSEREFAREMTAYLNQAIEQAAQKAGVQYVDISQALVGHRLCEAPSYDVAVNGLTAGTDAGVGNIEFLGKESYHPNALGQQLIEQAILRQSHNLTLSVPGIITDPTQSLLNKPKTNRPVAARVSVRLTDKKVIPKGSKVHVAADGPSLGLPPNHTYRVLIGDSGQQLGNLTGGSDGSVSGDIILPQDLSSGGHTLDISGDNQNGEPIDLTQPIYVGAGSADMDDDGVIDNLDSCPTAAHSGQDSDRDGIDDACDGFIGQPPASTSGGGSSAPSTSTGDHYGVPPPDQENDNTPLSGSPPQAVASFSGAAIFDAPAASTANFLSSPFKNKVVKMWTAKPDLGAAPLNLQGTDSRLKHLGSPQDFIPREKLQKIPWLLWSGLGVIAWWLAIILSGMIRSYRYNKLPGANGSRRHSLKRGQIFVKPQGVQLQ